MRKFLKWAAITIGCFILILATVLWVLVGKTNKRMARIYDVYPDEIVTLSDSATLAKGAYWAGVLCMDCHNTGYSGKLIFDDPIVGKIYSTNLTSGKGGIGGDYSDADWLRAIRHGVKKDGTPIFIMPSKDFNTMSDADMIALVSYLKSLPPVDQELPSEPGITLMAKVLVALGAFGEVFAAELIDHTAGYATAPEAAVTAEYGQYLVDVFGCKHCHGATLAGLQPATPGSPFSPNLTSGGEVGSWDFEQFDLVMRKGLRPDGRQLTEFMPYKATAQMSDQDMQAVYIYLKSLEGTQTAMK